MPIRRSIILAALLILTLAVAPALAGDRITPTRRAQAQAQLAGTPAARLAVPYTLMGAGDISADPATDSVADLATSEVIVQAHPAGVFTAGDNQYPRGQLADYQSSDGYQGSWGRLKGVTCPTVGNHEYADPLPGPAGFLAYFTPRCPARQVEFARTREGTLMPTVYAYPCAPGSGWWCYVLDSQGTHAEETGPSTSQDSNQLNWFRRHMAAHPTSRRLVFWHHPRFGNGAPWGDDLREYWLYAVSAYQSRVCLVVNGHSHSYERFTSMTPAGAIDTSFQAPRSFTVGTGGATLVPFTQPPRVGTRYRESGRFGVLRLELGAGRWTSEFDRADGTVADRVSASC